MVHEARRKDGVKSAMNSTSCGKGEQRIAWLERLKICGNCVLDVIYCDNVNNNNISYCSEY